MSDTTKVEIIGKQLEKIVDSTTQHPSGLSSGQIALLAASIGAMSAILSQLVVFLLTRFKEKSNIKKLLIADERNCIFTYPVLQRTVMHKVHKQYWYGTSIVFRPSTEDMKDSHERHFASNCFNKKVSVLKHFKKKL